MAKAKVELKHRRVLKIMSNDIVPRQEAMMQEGYSESYSRNGHIAETDSWQELMKNYLPDQLLAKRHKELLNKREVVKEYSHERGEYVQKVIDQPETQAVSKGLDMAYRLKKHYLQGEGEGNKTLIINISGETAIRYGINERIILNTNTESSSPRPA